ncbi:MAG: hypothetical protein ACRD16_08815, partial [Thermoanaerobaculia bacterium]
DAAHGCRTLPIRFGVSGAAKIMAPFFVAPWLLLSALSFASDPGRPGSPLLTGNHAFLLCFGIAMAAWGAYTASLLLRDPQALTSTENHPAWRHMYLMLMAAQTGFAAAYLV